MFLQSRHTPSSEAATHGPRICPEAHGALTQSEQSVWEEGGGGREGVVRVKKVRVEEDGVKGLEACCAGLRDLVLGCRVWSISELRSGLGSVGHISTDSKRARKETTVTDLAFS